MRKTGLHITGGTNLPLGKPPIVKLVDVSVPYVREVREKVGPGCLIIVRWVEDNLLDQPASVWFYRHLSQMQAMADPMVVFEGDNEVADSNAYKYSKWELDRIRLMHTVGLRSAVGSWSAGTPAFTVWPIYRPVLDEMRSGVDGDVLDVHCYWSDRADINNLWHTARWALPGFTEFAFGKKIVVSESGRDIMEGQGKAGWQLTATDEEFLEDLRQDDSLLCKYDNVIGTTVYQTGSIDEKWKHFEVSSIWARVVAEQEGGETMPESTIKLVSPVKHNPEITQLFGKNPNMFGYGPSGHPGMDWGCVTGTVMRAPVAGEVHIGNPNGAYKAYGTHVWIKGRSNEGETFWVIVAHLSRVLVDDGEMVQPGTIIALSGNTGNSTAPHCHLGIELKDIHLGFRDSHDPTFYWWNPSLFLG